MRFPTSNDTFRKVIALSVTLLLILALVPNHPTGSVMAFKPFSSPDYLKGDPTDVTHQDITEIAIKLLIKNEAI